MDDKIINIKIDRNLSTEIRIYCLRKGISFSEFVVPIIEKEWKILNTKKTKEVSGD